jgi:hypothetical protein
VKKVSEPTNEEIAKYAAKPVEELTPEERQTIIDYINLPEDQKRAKKKEERKFVRAKLPISQIEQLDQMYPGKRAQGIRKAVNEFLFKYARPEDDQLARAWEVLKGEFPETQGFQYFEGCKAMAKGLGIEENEAYPLLDKLCREGYAKRIKTGDYVVFSSRIGTEMQMQEEMRMMQVLREARELM